MSDDAILDTMLTLGGNFIQHLARAYQAADALNQARLREAFADKWQEYAELAALREKAEKAAR